MLKNCMKNKITIFCILFLFGISFLFGCGFVSHRELNYLTIAEYDDPTAFDVGPVSDVTNSFAAYDTWYAVSSHKKGVALFHDTKSRIISRKLVYYNLCFLGNRLYMLPEADPFFIGKTRGLCYYDLIEKRSVTIFEDQRIRCIEPYNDSLLIGFGQSGYTMEETSFEGSGLYLFDPNTEQAKLLIPDILCERLYVKDGLVYIEYYTLSNYLTCIMTGSKLDYHLMCYDETKATSVWDITRYDILDNVYSWCLMDHQSVLLCGFDKMKDGSINKKIVQCFADGSSKVILEHMDGFPSYLARDAQYIYFNIYLPRPDPNKDTPYQVLRYDLFSKQTEVLYDYLASNGHFDKWNNQLVFIFTEQQY